MWRTITGIAAGLVAWLVVVSLIDRGLRLWLPGYVAAEPLMAFTLTMKLARLAMAAVTSLVAGAVVRAIAPSSILAPWLVGLVLLILFVPNHVWIWSKFPLWYHLTFLLALAPLVALGARIQLRRPAVAA